MKNSSLRYLDEFKIVIKLVMVEGLSPIRVGNRMGAIKIND